MTSVLSSFPCLQCDRLQMIKQIFLVSVTSRLWNTFFREATRIYLLNLMMTSLAIQRRNCSFLNTFQRRRGHSLTTCNAAPPVKSKMAGRGPKIAGGIWKGVYLQVFGCSEQLSLNKFFYPSTPSMRKGQDGGEKKRGKKDF